jgi:hypothetical protein
VYHFQPWFLEISVLPSFPSDLPPEQSWLPSQYQYRLCVIVHVPVTELSVALGSIEVIGLLNMVKPQYLIGNYIAIVK